MRLTSPPSETVTVAINSSDEGEATASPASLKFAAAADGSDPSNPVYAWNDPRTVTVTGVDDDVDDGHQRYTITLDFRGTYSDYDGLADATVSGRNSDDDEEGLMVVESGGSTVTTEASGTDHTDTFTVRLSSRPRAAVAVATASSAPSEATASPASLMFNAANWSTPQTVTVTGVDDSAMDGSQPYTITLDPSSPGESGDSAYDGLTNVTVEGTNVDDDSGPTVTLAVAHRAIDESGSGNSTTVSATLSHASSAATTVRLTAPAGTTLSGTTLTIDAGETSSVDADAEARRQVTIMAQDNGAAAADRMVTGDRLGNQQPRGGLGGGGRS